MMRRPLQVTFRGMGSSEAMTARIEEEAAALESVAEGILGCRVLVEQPHRHHRQGNHFHVRVEVDVPGRHIVAGRDPEAAEQHADPYVALDEAFAAARRQLVGWREEARRHR